MPSAVIDSANGKLLVATWHGTNSGKPALFRCDLDGTGCSYSDISAGQGADSGFSPSAVIDVTNGKLLVVTSDEVHKPALFRCDLDGTGCSYGDISAGQGASSGLSPSAVIDVTNGKLLVVTSDHANSGKPALFRCDLDGTGCSYTDISAGQGEDSGQSPSAVIDTTNSKLLVVTQNGADLEKPALFRCNLDGTGCSYSDISAGQGPATGATPSAVIDTTNGKLLVATETYMRNAALFRCDLDGTGCSYSDISAGQSVETWAPSLVIDTIGSKLLVATTNGTNSRKPALFRCDLDGTGCSYTNISAGQGSASGGNPSAVIDATNAKLLVVTQNGDSVNAIKPALFSVCLQ